MSQNLCIFYRFSDIDPLGYIATFHFKDKEMLQYLKNNKIHKILFIKMKGYNSQ